MFPVKSQSSPASRHANSGLYDRRGKKPGNDCQCGFACQQSTHGRLVRAFGLSCRFTLRMIAVFLLSFFLLIVYSILIYSFCHILRAFNVLNCNFFLLVLGILSKGISTVSLIYMAFFQFSRPISRQIHFHGDI